MKSRNEVKSARAAFRMCLAVCAILAGIAMLLSLAACTDTEPVGEDGSAETLTRENTQTGTEVTEPVEAMTDAVSATEPATEPGPETDPETVTDTEPETETETEEETEMQTEPGIFNEGVVNYELEVDGNGETYVKATPTDGNRLGLDITDKTDLVGICYTMWFNAILGNGTDPVTEWPTVTDMQAKYGFSSEEGFGKGNNRETLFHYWGKPAQGYYRSSDTQAIRNNMTMLYNGGVDFLVLDFTFAGSEYHRGTGAWNIYIKASMGPLLDTIMQMRAEGLGTPYVVMWVNNDVLFDDIWQEYYSVEKWQDCFVYWNGKPFVMEWNYQTTETEHFTVRAMYGLKGKVSGGQWSYLEVENLKTVNYGTDGNPEHVCVCVATQENYMSNTSSAHGRQGGVFWYSQWLTAFEYHPKIVTLTWWNEWTAQLYHVGGFGYVFTDEFNQEYSRDIEPMEGGHGDEYYRWMCEYIGKYKAHKECPVLVEEGYGDKASRALSTWKRSLKKIQKD